MIKVKKNEMSQIAELFNGIDDSMVVACLQGYMGKAYVDNLPNPTVGLIISGEYSFFAGNPNSKEAKLLISRLFVYNDSDETIGIFSDHEPEWESVLLSVDKNSPLAVPRYGIVQKDYVFDKDLLQKYIDSLPEGYAMKLFDKDLYEQAMSQDWSKEFCETFASAEDYLEKGFGCAVVENGKLVSATSTMTVYDGGTEIQVATHPDYRRRGLAMPSSAAFLLECQRRGIRPCWDAANLTSKKMALALGYEYRGEYTTIQMKRKANGFATHKLNHPLQIL